MSEGKLLDLRVVLYDSTEEAAAYASDFIVRVLEHELEHDVETATEAQVQVASLVQLTDLLKLIDEVGSLAIVRSIFWNFGEATF